MIEIDGKIVSTDILTEYFCCDISKCRGECCVEGNSGAPLEQRELEILGKDLEAIKPFMKPEGIEAVEQQGCGVVDSDGDLTTTLIDDAECAWSVQADGITTCAIELAWKAGVTEFRKPISCHLYPIRLVRFRNEGCGLNYHRWDVCRTAVHCGGKEGIPVYVAVKDAIVREFGEEFYVALDQAAEFLKIDAGRG